MKHKNEIASCQRYRGYADMKYVEYKHPLKKASKYVLRITLVGSSPRVWREIAVPSTIKLTSLAHVIILAMGWEESHLSMFKKWRKEYHMYMDGADMYDYPIEDAGGLCALRPAEHW
jgi:Plasmid pRiA4b ORF-3-like protein.